MKRVDQHETLSEQDYGPWLDRATLFEGDGCFYLKLEGGYSKPYDEAWYRLSSRPASSLAELFPGDLWADPTSDQSVQLSEDLEVGVEVAEDQE